MLLEQGRTLVWGEPFAHCDVAGSLASQLRAFSKDWPEEKWISASLTADAATRWTANLYPPVAKLFEAHRAFWLTLFAQPALQDGWRNWGIKETRWGLPECRYLKWLFPRSRFVFLYRNPYHAYSSYRRWGDWYYRWPDQLVSTPRQFGKIWRRSVTDFLGGYQSVDGFLVPYEALSDQTTLLALSEYLGEKLSQPKDLMRLRGYQGPEADAANPLDMARLEAVVQPVAARLGYAAPPIPWPKRAWRWRSSRSASSSPRADARV